MAQNGYWVAMSSQVRSANPHAEMGNQSPIACSIVRLLAAANRRVKELERERDELVAKVMDAPRDGVVGVALRVVG